MSVVAIGNFDGVHRGHQQVLARVGELARAHSMIPCALTFDPHPAEVLGRRAPPRLSGAMRKRALLQRSVERVWVEPFTHALAAESPEQFVSRVLVERLGARHVVVGEDFRFGHARAGTVQTLRELGAQHGFEVHPYRLVQDAGGALSSSRARQLLGAGEVEAAAQVLGRYHALFGEIVHGKKLGRTLGVPTANFGPSQEMLPAPGIYAVFCCVATPDAPLNPWALGVANVGTRPTVDPNETLANVEVHLLDFDGDLYGKPMAVAFVERQRPELRFDSLEALTEQMRLDLIEGRSRLQRADLSLLS